MSFGFTVQESSFGLSAFSEVQLPPRSPASRLGGSKNFTDKGECSLFKQMNLPPPHVLAQLDALIVGQSITAPSVEVEDDDDRSISSAAFGIESSATSFSEPVEDDSGGARTASSRFWGVYWNRQRKQWHARYIGADGKHRHIGLFDDEEEAARAVNKAIRDAGLEGKRHMNAVDATGALVPKRSGAPHRPIQDGDRSAVVAPDPSRAPTETTSKFWGVTWSKRKRRWAAQYKDANGKQRGIGLFDTQEEAAHAYNAAIRRAGLEGRRKTNPVVDGQLVPRERKAPKKRRRDEPAATPSPRARRR